jgi:hypothetical protein
MVVGMIPYEQISLQEEIDRLRTELAAERERTEGYRLSYLNSFGKVAKLRETLERLNGWEFAIQQLTADLKHANDVLKGDEDE